MAVWTTMGVLGVFALLYKVYDYLVQTYRLRTSPLYHVVTVPGSIIGEVLPPNKLWLTRAGMNVFLSKHTPFEICGWNCHFTLAPIPSNRPVFWIADADVVKEIAGNQKRFCKPLELYGALALFGRNIVVVEGDMWKRHRKISQPAFSEKNNRLVWNAGMSVVNELIDDVWDNKNEIVIPQACDLTIRIALMVLTIAGFGQPSSWETQSQVPSGHKINFADAIYLVSTRIIEGIITPKWAFGLTKHLRETRAAYKELGMYMDEMITERKASKGDKIEEKADLLTNLIAASGESVDEKGVASAQLTVEELRGNIYVYIVAGHETNAHGLAYSLGLLALYQDEQEKLYQHIKSVVGDRMPTYDDFPALAPVLGCYYEALRMFPPVNVVPKLTTQDETFNVSSADPNSVESKQMYVPGGTMLYLNVVGVHYNPKYWKDPRTFRPGRFSEEWDRDALLSFSAGQRSCIGRKFAEVEGVSVLTTLLSRYSIHLTPEKEVELSGLSRHEQIDRLLRSSITLTLTPADLPILFKRRT